MAQPVHWQSAFWGLAALAINSAVQDSGRVVGLPAKYQLALKTSPLICLLDTVYTIGSIARQSRHNSYHSSLQSAAAFREGHKHCEKHVTPTERLLSIVAGVAAILQLIKLFGLSGIPWTQAFGSFYFASYLIQEVLFHLGAPTYPRASSRDHDSAEGQWHQRARDFSLLATSAIVLQSLIDVYTTGVSLGLAPNENRRSLAYYAAVTIAAPLFDTWLLSIIYIFLVVFLIEMCIPVILAAIMAYLIVIAFRKFHFLMDQPFTNTSKSAGRRSGTFFEPFDKLKVIFGLLCAIFIVELGILWYFLGFLGLVTAKLVLFLNNNQEILFNSSWRLLVYMSYYFSKGFGPILGACAASFIIGVMGKSLNASLWKRETSASHLPSLPDTRGHPWNLKTLSEVEVESWVAMCFGVVNVICVLLFYGYGYTEEGTFKPS